MLIPIKNKLIVLAIGDPNTWGSAGLIARPDSTKDRSDQGIVKAVGPEVRYINVGDYVVFSPYSGTVLDDEDEGRKHILLTEDGVIALVTPPTTTVQGMYGIDAKLLTSEAALQLIRATYEDMPRVIQMRQKFEDRLKLGLVD